MCRHLTDSPKRILNLETCRKKTRPLGPVRLSKYVLLSFLTSDAALRHNGAAESAYSPQPHTEYGILTGQFATKFENNDSVKEVIMSLKWKMELRIEFLFSRRKKRKELGSAAFA